MEVRDASMGFEIMKGDVRVATSYPLRSIYSFSKSLENIVLSYATKNAISRIMASEYTGPRREQTKEKEKDL